jgi:hypothetical protein
MRKLSMIGTTSSGTLMVLLGMYVLYVHAWNQHQLRRLLIDYIDHYNTHRPTARSINTPQPLPNCLTRTRNRRPVGVAASPATSPAESSRCWPSEGPWLWGPAPYPVRLKLPSRSFDISLMSNDLVDFQPTKESA